MTRKILIVLLILAGFVGLGAVSTVLIKDSDGDTMPLSTGGFLQLPGNLTGGANGPVLEIDHNTDLLNAGTFTHTMLDAHATDNAVHYTQAAIDHAAIQNRGANTHAQLDSHVADAAKHFVESSIQHQNVIGAGTQTHAQLDSHVADSTRHYTQASIDHSILIGASGFRNHSAIDAQLDAQSDYNAATNIHLGTLDAHAADSGIHAPIFDNLSTAPDALWSSQYLKNYIDATGGSGYTLTLTDNTTTVSPVSSITFNPDTGFTVVDTGAGTARIDMGSTFNPIQVSGQSDLDSTGEEPLEIVAGTGISLTTNAASTPKSLTITATGGSGGGLVVDVDTTCYVATTGSDTTGDGTSGSPYATPHKCLAAYAGHKINSDVWLTIELAAGTYNLTTSLEITHPNGNRIKIRGANTYQTTVSSIASSSGSAGNYAIVVNVASAANMAVGRYVTILNASGGTNPTFLEGAWPISAINGTQVTISSSHVVGVPSGSVAATLTTIPTLLSFSSSHGLVLSGAALAELSGVAIRASGYRAIMMDAAARLSATNIALADSDRGVHIQNNSLLFLTSSGVSRNVYNVYSYMGSADIRNTAITGASSSGVYAVSLARVVLPCNTISGNTTGVTATDISGVIIQTGWCGAGGTLSGNTTNNSPALNTVGNYNSYIRG